MVACLAHSVWAWSNVRVEVLTDIHLSRSPSSGEGEGLLPAAEQLPVLRQQPVHQPQRQRRVGLRRRLRLQLRVRGGGAPQQEEAALGGQLEGRAGVRQGGIGGVPSVLGPPCLGSHCHCPLRGMKRALGCCCPPPPATQTIQTREAAWPCLNSTPHPLSCRRGRAGMHCFILFVQTVCTNPQRSSFSEGGELFVSDSRVLGPGPGAQDRVLERFYEVLEDVPARRTAANISLGV